jgi:hypothetical protein
MITIITDDYACDYGLTSRNNSMITIITAKRARHTRETQQQHTHTTHTRARL